MGQSALQSCAETHDQRWSAMVERPAEQVVRLAITPLNDTYMPKLLTAYHTSISIGDVELSFDRTGIRVHQGWHKTGTGVRVHQGWHSHQCLTSGKTSVRELGVTDTSLEELLAAMRQHFAPGSYDVLRKNCNSCTDCALGYLFGRSLDDEFSALERLGVLAENYFGLVGLLMNYTANPKADLFQKDSALEHLKCASGHLQKSVHKLSR